MKFHYYGLVFCLSIGIFELKCYAQSETLHQEILESSETYNAKDIKALEDSIDKLQTIIVELNRRQQKLSEKVDEIANRYDELAVVLSSPAVDREQLEKILSVITTLIDNYRNLAEKVNTIDTKLDNLTFGEVPVDTSGEKLEGKTEKPTKTTTEQQYVKLKLKEGGQEMELLLDPMYTDMNLDIARKRSPVKSTAEQSEETQQKVIEIKETPSDIVKYVEKSLTGKLSEKQENISEEVIKELHKAQKLYYRNKYRAALDAVQRSLYRQETALGYALEGSIYFTLGDLEAAIASWEEALRLDPEMEEVRRIVYKYKR